MTRYYLFRHGQTFFSKFHLPYLWNSFSVKILPESIPSLERIATYLKDIPSDLNTSSEFKRCVQSTRVITKIIGNKFYIDPRLNEYHLYRETLGTLRKRIRSFIAEVEQKKFQTVVVCTHGAIMASLKHLLLNDRFSVKQLYDYPKPGILIHIEGKKINQIDFNRSWPK